MVETVSAVAKELQTKTAADVKDIYHNTVKEVVSTTTDEDHPSVMEEISDAIEIVKKEVLEGIDDVGEAIKEHPELIAE
jgi:hypothetical protein